MSTSWQSSLLDLHGAQGAAGVCGDHATPARFGSLKEEYHRLRQGVGLTDYNHYGKFQLQGLAALDVVNRVTLADASRLPVNRALATLMPEPDGSVLCDLYVLNQGDRYLLLAEGAEPARVLDVLREECEPHAGSVTLTDLTHRLALAGLDGPFAWEVLKDLVGIKILGVRYLGVMEDQFISQVPVTILRAGKTGEFGYVLLHDAPDAAALRDLLLAAGREYDLKPCGYEALDLCKLENRFVNMKREGRRARNALELNCRVMVAGDKDDYIGAGLIRKALADGIQRRLIGLVIDWPAGPDVPEGLPPIGAEVYCQETCIGELANAGYSYTRGQHIGVAFLDVGYAYVGLDYSLKAGDRICAVRTVSAPFILNRSITIRPQEVSYKDGTSP